MEAKINIAEILENCPSGMKLYSPLVGDCKFVKVHDYESRIIVELEDGATVSFQTDGRYYDYPNAECMLFPSKDKTTWEGFQMPFIDGDVVATTTGLWVGITTGGKKGEFIPTYCVIYGDDKFEAYLDGKAKWAFRRLATEEEKKKLFDAIKENGYKWNPETKTLEKLPKFKVGDKIIKKNGLRVPFVITGVSDVYYWSNTENSVEVLPVADQDDWELVPIKFDITTLVPFESRVLVRDNNLQKWSPAMWGYYDCDSQNYPYKLSQCIYLHAPIGVAARYCIPYEGNEHLLGTTDDCDEYFKTW